MLVTKRWLAPFALLLPFLLCGAAAAQNTAPAGKTFVMKLATPTLNDGQHEWMRRSVRNGSTTPRSAIHLS